MHSLQVCNVDTVHGRLHDGRPSQTWADVENWQNHNTWILGARQMWRQWTGLKTTIMLWQFPQFKSGQRPLLYFIIHLSLSPPILSSLYSNLSNKDKKYLKSRGQGVVSTDQFRFCRVWQQLSSELDVFSSNWTVFKISSIFTSCSIKVTDTLVHQKYNPMI